MPRFISYLVAGSFSFYNLLQLSLLNVTNQIFIANLHLTTTSFGIFSSSFLWGNTLGLIPIGLLIDRYSVRKVGLSFLSLTISACFILALSHSFLIGTLMRFLQGLASAASLLISIRLATQLFKSNANVAVGGIVTLALSGGIAGNYIFAHLLNSNGFRMSLIIIGILGILIWIGMYCFLHENLELQKLRLWDSRNEFKYTLLNPQNIIAGICLGLMNSPIFILATLWGNFYLMHVYHLNNVQSAALSTLLFLGVMIGSPCWGLIADKFLNSIAVLYLGCIIALVASALFFSIPNLTMQEIGLIFLVLGFSCGVQDVIYPLISKGSPQTSISTCTGVAALVFNGIGAISQLAFGWLMQFSHITKLSFLFFFSAFIICMIFLFYLNWRLTYREQKAIVF